MTIPMEQLALIQAYLNASATHIRAARNLAAENTRLFLPQTGNALLNEYLSRQVSGNQHTFDRLLQSVEQLHAAVAALVPSPSRG